MPIHLAMKRVPLVAVAILALGCAPPPRDARSVRLERASRHGYAFVSEDDGHRIAERDFAHMYLARTGSHELDSTDHPQSTRTILGLTGAGMFATAATITAAAGAPGTKPVAISFGVTAAVALLCVVLDAAEGSPWEHDLSRERAEELVHRYNAAPMPQATSRATVVVTSAGVGLAF